MQSSPKNPRRRPSSHDMLRRSSVACERCRRRKQKCTGSPPYPCSACEDAGHACIYSESEKRINVPESYLLKLQAQARLASQSLSRHHEGMPSPAETTAATEVDWTFPGTDNWVLCRPGQYHYMGNSSSAYIANRLNPTTETLAWHMHPHYEDTSWIRRPPPMMPEMPQLPPFDFARRLYEAQKAYIGTIFSFLDDAGFEERVQHVYSSPPNLNDREDCLIYCQMLLVFGFGQMYSVNQWTGNDGPPGFSYFKHALQFLPDLREDSSILFVEVLSYVAYFMQTLNRRDSAYLYIGQAQRMAVSLGLHQEVRDPSHPGLDDRARERRRRVWWSVYSLERLQCVTSGHPLSMDDDDIDVCLPSPIEGDESDIRRANVLRHYTLMTRILGRIGREVYRKKRRQSGTSLAASILDIMRCLADWFNHLPADVRLDPGSMDKAISRDTVSIYLHYYHCINMTARPLLLYAVQRQMAANAGGQRDASARWEDGLSPEVVSVIDASITAARSSTAILNAAAKFNLVATYGFIDGEQAFSAALLLVMVNMAFPYREMNAAAMDTALLVLQSMAEKGNKYIRACHTLLTKMRATIKPIVGADESQAARQAASLALVSVPQVLNDQPAWSTPASSSNTCRPQNPSGQPGQPGQNGQSGQNGQPGQPGQPGQLPLMTPQATGGQQHADPAQQEPDPFNIDNVEDPAVWAEVIDSIGIDMDRQWIGMALMREEGLGAASNAGAPPNQSA